MGATSFLTVQYGRNPERAFTKAKELAKLHERQSTPEHFHMSTLRTSSYTGTILEKSSYKMITVPVEVDLHTFSEVLDYARELIDTEGSPVDNKWGPAGCIQCGPSPRMKDLLDESRNRYLFFGWASS